MRNYLFAGIDVGGTSTRIALANADGLVVGKGFALGAGFTEVSEELASNRLSEAWAQACQQAGHDPALPVHGLFAGFGSLAAPRDAMIAKCCLKSARIGAQYLRVGHDSENAQAGARPHGAGVHAISGTGSVVVASDGMGRIVRVGGWGPGIGDEGSAWWVACTAVQVLSKRHDAGRPTNTQDRALLQALGIRHPRELLGAVFGDGGLDRSTLASLARVICKLAQDGDRSALAILKQGAEALGTQIVQASERMKLSAPTVTTSGGMFEHAPGFARQMITQVKRLGLDARLTPAEGSPLLGAVLLAARLDRRGDNHAREDLTFVRNLKNNTNTDS